jgi:hypothetical protein
MIVLRLSEIGRKSSEAKSIFNVLFIRAGRVKSSIFLLRFDGTTPLH